MSAWKQIGGYDRSATNNYVRAPDLNIGLLNSSEYFNGSIDMCGNFINDLHDPLYPQDIATKKWVIDNKDLILRGVKGAAGHIGPTGFKGISGVTGLIGYNGLSPQGPTGPQGITGRRGPTGYIGIKPDGATGPRGATGARGQIGFQGKNGLTGPTGAKGENGLTGMIGNTGSIGFPGVTGLDGLIGIAGNVGPTGPNGITGVTGPIGKTGEIGEFGIPGPKGPKGPSTNKIMFLDSDYSELAPIDNYPKTFVSSFRAIETYVKQLGITTNSYPPAYTTFTCVTPRFVDSTNFSNNIIWYFGGITYNDATYQIGNSVVYEYNSLLDKFTTTPVLQFNSVTNSNFQNISFGINTLCVDVSSQTLFVGGLSLSSLIGGSWWNNGIKPSNNTFYNAITVDIGTNVIPTPNASNINTTINIGRDSSMNFVNCACSYKPKQFIIGGYFSLAGPISNTSFISPNNILDITINYPNSEDNYSYCGNVSGDGIYTLFDNYNQPIFKLLTSYLLETNNGGIYIFSTCNYAKSNNITINSNNTSYIACYNPFSKTYTWLNETSINGITIGYPHSACFTEGIFYDLNASSSILYAGEIIYNGNNCIMKINNTSTPSTTQPTIWASDPNTFIIINNIQWYGGIGETKALLGINDGINSIISVAQENINSFTNIDVINGSVYMNFTLGTQLYENYKYKYNVFISTTNTNNTDSLRNINLNYLNFYSTPYSTITFPKGTLRTSNNSYDCITIVNKLDSVTVVGDVSGGYWYITDYSNPDIYNAYILTKSINTNILPAPTSQTPITVGDGQLTVYWTLSLNNTRIPVTYITITYSTNDYDSKSISLLPTSTQATITGLINGLTYTIKIFGVNVVGPGNSLILTGMARASPNIPQITLPSVSIPGTIGDGQLTFSWNINNGGYPITSYIINYGETSIVGINGNQNPSSLMTFPSTDSIVTQQKVTITGLKNGVQYTFIFKAVNSYGTGYPTIIQSTPFSLPGSPILTTPTQGNGIDNNKITLTWNPPTSDGGNSIKSYNISYSPAGTDGISNISIPITNILSQIYSQTINNLVNGTQYTFNLVAYNSSLTPGKSSIVTCTPLGPPSSPSLSILFSLDSSNNVITTLKWTRPTNNGGSSIITYKIMYGINNSNMTLWNPTIPFTGDSYQTDITGLLVGSIYTFSITAVNIFGEGLPGKITSSIGSPPDTPVLDTNNIIPSDYFPGTINNSGIPTSPSTYSCTIKWFPSQSLLPITGYKIIITPITPEMYPQTVITTTNTSIKFTKLLCHPPTGRYEYYIYAINAAGESLPISQKLYNPFNYMF